MHVTIETVKTVIAQGVENAWLVHCQGRRRALLIGEWDDTVAGFMPDRYSVIYNANDSGLTEEQVGEIFAFVKARATAGLSLDGVELEA